MNAAQHDRMLALLTSWRDGPHGESERRVVAEFVLDSMGELGGLTPVDLALSLADAALALAKQLRNLSDD